MRLTLSHRSWAVLAVCALSGCTTFDRPVASTKFPDASRQEQRLQDDVNRRIQAGDYEGAKRLLDQADADKGGSPGRSHAKSDAAHDSGIQQVGYQTTVPSREEMIRELVKNELPQRQNLESQRYREMPMATLKQLYHNQQQALALGHQQINQRDLGRETGSASTTTNNAVEAPNPRSSTFGGTTPWPTNSTELPSATVAGQIGNNLPQPEATAPIAATLAVTGNGVRLGGIQTAATVPATPPATPPAGNVELPMINPAAPGSTLLPVISPRRSSIPETVAPTVASSTSSPNAIEQVTGLLNTPLPLTPGNDTSARPNLPQNTNFQGHSATIPGVASTGAPATLPGTLEPLQRPAVPAVERPWGKISNPLPSGMQKINQTAKSAFDRTINGFIPPSPQPQQVDLATQPATAAVDVTPQLNALISQLETQLSSAAPGATDAEKLEHVRRHVNLRMLYLMAGQNDRAIEAIKGIDGEEQEFWQHLLWSIANYFDAQGLPRASDRATQTIAELRTATQKLKAQADLELRNVTFCQRIDSYGNFERLSRDQFPPGSAVLLYAEVENFGTMNAEGDRQMTSLKSTVEFYKAGGQSPIQSIPFKVTQDYCRAKRRDFFLAFEFSIPQQLEAGVYTLVLKTDDQVGKKVATAKVNFTVE